jgi:trehalose-6-phosphate synthase
VVFLEYITCQEKQHGVLLLSEIAGAAELLTESVKFNPWDRDVFAKAIYLSLTMGEDKKSSR